MTNVCATCGAAMLERHAVIIHEHRRGDPPAVVRLILERLLAMLADGSLVLPVGKTRHLEDVPT